MDNQFNLEEYLSGGIENIIKGAIKASFKNTKQSIFLAKYALSSKKFRKIRKKYEDKGEHIPPFLIASITNTCNLNCKGCYARATNICNNDSSNNLLTSSEWNNIFQEAKELGIGFILLAGGEPMVRYDIMETAANHPDILFPIFTNGTLMNEKYISLLDYHRNLIPVISIEGDKNYTDMRRGDGIYDKILLTMSTLKNRDILFGTSITVTKENLTQVTDTDFLTTLYELGCKVIFYIEYVPINEETKDLAPTDTEREYLTYQLSKLRNTFNNMLFISFPGDEKTSGGCLAAGRGFFHISPNGSAEPCPFSPFSDTNIRDTGLKEALKSPLFKKLHQEEFLLKDHIGGCVLFEQRDLVQQLCEGDIK